jgi:hypothetical protein
VRTFTPDAVQTLRALAAKSVWANLFRGLAAVGGGRVLSRSVLEFDGAVGRAAEVLIDSRI